MNHTPTSTTEVVLTLEQQIAKLRFDLEEMETKFAELASEYELLYNNLDALADGDLDLDPSNIRVTLMFSLHKVQEIGIMPGVVATNPFVQSVVAVDQLIPDRPTARTADSEFVNVGSNPTLGTVP